MVLEDVSKLFFGFRLRRIGASFKILDIPIYACGIRPGAAARVPAKPFGEDGTLNQNPNFEKTSKTTNKRGYGTMTKAELVEKAAKEAKISKVAAAAALNS